MTERMHTRTLQKLQQRATNERAVSFKYSGAHERWAFVPPKEEKPLLEVNTNIDSIFNSLLEAQWLLHLPTCSITVISYEKSDLK